MSEETHKLTKLETLLGRGARVESSRVREPRRTALPRGSQSRVYGDGASFRVVFGQSFGLRVLPSGTCIAQPRWMPVRRILGGGQTQGVSFQPFPDSSGWWWLVSSVFLTRTSCHKILQMVTGAWPEWVVLVSVFHLTKGEVVCLFSHSS